MDAEKKQKILNGVATIPVKNLVNYIINGDVLQHEIISRLEASNSRDAMNKIADIKSSLVAFDDNEWKKAQESDTIDSYNSYLSKFPSGIHAQDCQMKIDNLDDLVWTEAESKLSEIALNQYKSFFPSGKHIHQCDEYLNDLPWLTVKSKKPAPTIDDYENYQRSYPGKHVSEIQEAINTLNDDKDWHNAESADSLDAYRAYLNQHPNGKYVNLANNAINSSAGKNRIIGEIRANKNAYNPKELQNFIGNHIITENNLHEVFSEEEVREIVDYIDPTELPDDVAPEKLLPGNTEVYFWGTPSSGKTCAMGAILSAANKYGILHKKKCQGKAGNYMDKLGNIFINNGIAIFPKGTPDYCIQEMVFSIRDDHDNEHSLAFIDLAGEVFRAMYKKEKGLTEDSYVREQALNKTLEYLKDTTNKKIHFFIVAYGEENKKWEDIYMHDYLETTMNYLNENKVIRKGTNGVYILVTKCDNMPCSVEERANYAKKYIIENMPAFYNNMKMVCKNAGVRDFEVLPSSVGDVFAQKLCRFDSENTDIVLDKLILKSQAPKSGLLGKIINWLNS